MSSIKMSERAKQLWIEALQSGSYQQGKGFLRVGDEREPRYCATGVLCELAVRDPGSGVFRVTCMMPPTLFLNDHTEVTFYGPSPLITPNKDEYSSTLIPEVVRVWAAMPTTLSENEHAILMRLATLNDSGWEFPALAAWIDSEIEV